MSKPIFKLMKVVDCNSMPEDLREVFINIASKLELNNNTYINWNSHVLFESEDESSDNKLISDWLLTNDITSDDKVLIHFWW